MNKDEKIYHEIVRKLAFGLVNPNVGLIYSKDLCSILQSDLPNKGIIKFIVKQVNIVSKYWGSFVN